MIGPRKKKMPDKYVCDQCGLVISKTLGETTIFPSRTVHYCTYFPDGGVSFIKRYPYTPEWCPVLSKKEEK